MSCRVIRPLTLATLLVLATTAMAQPWPTYRHDNRRSGVTGATLDFPLSLQWVWKSPSPPQTAWSGPAKWDAYSSNAGLQSMRNFDPCFYVTADQDRVYFGSSADDAAHALDANTGQEQWAYITGAAVRLPPTIAGRHVLFGSDDGRVYCCDKQSGELIWSLMAAPRGKLDALGRISSDRKLISLWPIRTGVLVDGKRATFAASLVPWEPSVLWTVDVESGKLSGKGCFRRQFAEVTLQGALLASDDLLYAPQGRAAPLAFDRRDGTPKGAIEGAGGVFCILSEDEMLFAGPPNQREDEDQIRIASIRSKSAVVSFGRSDRILVDGDRAWLAVGRRLRSLDRKSYVHASGTIDRATRDLKNGRQPVAKMQKVIQIAKQKQQSSWGWSVQSPPLLDMIKAGDWIVVGHQDEVRSYHAVDGRPGWTASVEGAAHGLAVAGGRLFVSTDRGFLYAFGTPPSQ